MNSAYQLMYIDEPKILFGHGQKMEDPREGLAFFGPLEPKLREIRSGVVGTRGALEKFKAYVRRIQKPVYNANEVTRPFFPGFEAVFGCKWDPDAVLFKEVAEKEIDEALAHKSNNVRTFDVVSIFLKRIKSAADDDERVDVWFVIVPDKVYTYCRPNSPAPNGCELKIPLLSKAKAKIFVSENWLFDFLRKEDDAKTAEKEKYDYDAQFHDQFKMRLLPMLQATQILRESTLDWRNYVRSDGKPIRDFSRIEGHLAWTLSTAAYYKAGGKPWQLSDVRPGVCYLGLVYKKYEYSKDERNACCAAQMFLDNGDGTIFRGELGPWYNPKTREFHLDATEARALIGKAITSYYEKMGEYPKELFIHARTRFGKDEWRAFTEALPPTTKIVGVSITPKPLFKLYRQDSRYPIMRGLAAVFSVRWGMLWTVGFVPHIQTALGLETPSPLDIRIDKGEADITVVLKDILALTKLNYNACQYGDGLPVTLRFADSVGNILTASARQVSNPPLAFKYYI